MVEHADRIKGAVYGLAYGDAYGAPTEFMKHDFILTKNIAFPAHAFITDDTQMSLYVMGALRTRQGLSLLKQLNDSPKDFMHLGQDSEINNLFATAFISWYDDPDNTNYRSPGATCLQAIVNYRTSPFQFTGLEGTIRDSKGCGANMRAPWLGLLNAPESTIIALSASQAAVTHGHPTGVAASVITSLIMSRISEGYAPLDGNWFTVAEGLTHYVNRVVNNSLWSAASDRSETLQMASDGLLDIRRAIGESQARYNEFMASGEDDDLCDYFGEGWVAEEALMCALGALSRYPDNPTRGIRRLARTNGDSDSIGAIGGAYLGGLVGYEKAWDDDWEQKLEPRYQQELSLMTAAISTLQ